MHFAESCCVVALGIDMDGVKHPLALVEGSTDNATLVTELLVGLRDHCHHPVSYTHLTLPTNREV